MVLEKYIHGIEVVLDTDIDGVGDFNPDRVSGCWLTKGDFSGSLELALQLGGLEDSEGNFLDISQNTLETIENLAVRFGY